MKAHMTTSLGSSFTPPRNEELGKLDSSLDFRDVKQKIQYCYYRISEEELAAAFAPNPPLRSIPESKAVQRDRWHGVLADSEEFEPLPANKSSRNFQWENKTGKHFDCSKDIPLPAAQDDLEDPIDANPHSSFSFDSSEDDFFQLDLPIPLPLDSDEAVESSFTRDWSEENSSDPFTSSESGQDETLKIALAVLNFADVSKDLISKTANYSTAFWKSSRCTML